jgi:pimeloyl-ACP methyl ester carboxylesterase
MCDILAQCVLVFRAMARIALLAALLALAFPAAASAFDAHGSAQQVYVTGLTPGAPTVLVRPGGKTVTRAADPQGDRLDAFFSDVELVELDAVAHFAPVEAPEAFAAAIRARAA